MNVHVRLAHRLFERRTAPIVAQTVGLARELTRSAVTPPVRASHSHDRCTNCLFGKRTNAFGSHTAGFDRRTAPIIAQTVGLANKLTRSPVTPPVRASHSHDRCTNCLFGKRTNAFSSHTAGFERRTAPIVAQTVGLASELTRSAVTPPVRASYSHDRCTNCLFGTRTDTFGSHTAGSSVAQPRSLCKL